MYIMVEQKRERNKMSMIMKLGFAESYLNVCVSYHFLLYLKGGVRNFEVRTPFTILLPLFSSQIFKKKWTNHKFISYLTGQVKTPVGLPSLMFC